jgi:hypothetical protein
MLPAQEGMPMAIWNQFNPRERLVAIGAGLIVLSFLVAIISYGVGSNTLALIGAIAVAVILYLKHAPNQTIHWPASTTLIIGAIAAIVALFVLIDVLTSLRWIGFFGVSALLALLLEAAGAALMAWGAWQEYQIEKPALPAGLTSSGSGSATSAPPPAAPPATPPTTPSDTDEAPPA